MKIVQPNITALRIASISKILDHIFFIHRMLPVMSTDRVTQFMIKRGRCYSLVICTSTLYSMIMFGGIQYKHRPLAGIHRTFHVTGQMVA